MSQFIRGIKQAAVDTSGRNFNSNVVRYGFGRENAPVVQR